MQTQKKQEGNFQNGTVIIYNFSFPVATNDETRRSSDVKRKKQCDRRSKTDNDGDDDVE